MSPGARKSTLPSGARSPCLAVLSFTLALTVLLCAAAAPRVHAQTDDDPHKPTDDWAVDGTVLVSLVVRHVIIFGHGHGLQRAIIDESQHRTPERLIMAQH